MTFLNRNLQQKFTWHNPTVLSWKKKKCTGCPQKKSIYGLKQDSRQWYLKVHETIRKFRFEENEENNSIYAKFKNGKIIFLIPHVDDILLASSDI